MLNTKVIFIIKSSHPSQVSFSLSKPFYSLTHLPKPILYICEFRTKVDSKSVLLVFMPPTFKSPTILPLIISVALSSILYKFTSVFVSISKRQFTHSIFLICKPVSHVNLACRPSKYSKSTHFISFPTTFVNSFVLETFKQIP
jgi:hypothetical protein